MKLQHDINTKDAFQQLQIIRDSILDMDLKAQMLKFQAELLLKDIDSFIDSYIDQCYEQIN